MIQKTTYLSMPRHQRSSDKIIGFFSLPLGYRAKSNGTKKFRKTKFKQSDTHSFIQPAVWESKQSPIQHSQRTIRSMRIEMEQRAHTPFSVSIHTKGKNDDFNSMIKNGIHPLLLLVFARIESIFASTDKQQKYK